MYKKEIAPLKACPVKSAVSLYQMLTEKLSQQLVGNVSPDSLAAALYLTLKN